MKPLLSLGLALVAVAAAQELPDGPGKAEVMKVCDSCHGAGMLIGEARTASQWNDVVNDMIARGAEGSDEELRRVVNYLTKAFPPASKVNVNAAAAKELQTRLDLSIKEAEALVQYREQNGKFKSFEDLKKVSGLDVKKLDTKKDRLAF